jgi:xylan 1,4-beta-xylosidase
MQVLVYRESACHLTNGCCPLNVAENHSLISNRWQEALHGVASSRGVTFADAGHDYSYATSFPQPILMGAVFDDDLIHSVATIISTEARAVNNGNMSGLNFWTP